MAQFTSTDLIAIILIIGIFAIHLLGHMEWHTEVLAMIVAFYFGAKHAEIVNK